MHWRRKWHPTPVFLPGESQGREAWLAAFYGVAQSRTRLKRRSSSRASLVVQVVKNSPAIREIWVRSLGWEDPLEEDMATHSSILAWGIPMDRDASRATVHGVSKGQIRLAFEVT